MILQAIWISVQWQAETLRVCGSPTASLCPDQVEFSWMKMWRADSWWRA